VYRQGCYGRVCVSSPSTQSPTSPDLVVLMHIEHHEVEVEVNLLPTVSRPVCLGVRRPFGTRDQFFFLLEISFRQFAALLFCSALSDEKTGL
jgi:hypothetical protein